MEQLGLVHPIPDEPTLQRGIAIDDVPIILQISHRVTHRVRVLAEDERPFWIGLGVGLNLVNAVVHRHKEIGVGRLATALVLHRA